MTHKTRIYLDFDGVLNLLDPAGNETGIVRVGDAAIPAQHARWLVDVTRDPAFEIIWATHREDDVYTYTDLLGLPRYPHLTFTDPTGSKVKDIIAHYEANPCDEAVVYEDSLTSAEIEALNAAGLCVEIYENTMPVSFHPATKENQP